MTEFTLSDLRLAAPGLGRLRHGLAGRSRLRFVRRLVAVGVEVAAATLIDRLRPLSSNLHAVADGAAPSGSGSLALYVHWSPTGAVSDMVVAQIAAWRDAGFNVVFVTNTAPPLRDWNRLSELSVLRIARDNIGRDFGGWRDALSLALERFGTPNELLLANDSVLGPVRPMTQVVAALRRGGEGMFGLTESRGGGAHLQSYLLLARGQRAVADVSVHLAACRPSRSKWRLVQQAEIGLTRRMLMRGHRVAAVFGWERIAPSLDASVLDAFGSRFAEPDALNRYPLNPTHHLWRVLVERFGFPYLKTELVLRNPGGLPGVERWPELVDAATRAVIEQHLRIMRR